MTARHPPAHERGAQIGGYPKGVLVWSDGAWWLSEKDGNREPIEPGDAWVRYSGERRPPPPADEYKRVHRERPITPEDEGAVERYAAILTVKGLPRPDLSVVQEPSLRGWLSDPLNVAGLVAFYSFLLGAVAWLAFVMGRAPHAS